MQKLVTNGDLCTCSNGSISCPLMVIDPLRKMKVDGKSAAIATDNSIANVSTFGMCNNINNPAVAAATAAAQGVLTPAPCVPVAIDTWNNTVKKTSINGVIALGENSTLNCIYGGCIKIENAACLKSKSE